MKPLNLKLNLSQYLVLKNINQKDFLAGKSQSDLENISRLLNVTLDLKPLEAKQEVKPIKVDLPPSMEQVKQLVADIEKKEELVVENNSENVTGHISKLLQFVNEVSRNQDTDEILTSSSRKKRKG
jgi:hypothetical protein